MKTKIPTQTEYLAREIADATAFRSALAKQPLLDRKAARQEYQSCLESDLPKLIRSVDFLFNGDYGCGQLELAKSAIILPRGNAVARIGQLVAAFEFLCPSSEAAQAWLGLSDGRKIEVNLILQCAIDEFKNELQKTTEERRLERLVEMDCDNDPTASTHVFGKWKPE